MGKYIDLENCKINLFKTIIIEYYTMTELATVGVVYIPEEKVFAFNVCTGMTGFEGEIDASALMEFGKDEINLAIGLLLEKLKRVGD